MVPEERDLSTLAEDSSSVPRTYSSLRLPCNSISRGSDADLWPLRAAHTHSVYRYIQSKQTNKQTNINMLKGKGIGS